MAARTDTFDLAPLHLRAGEGRRMELEVPMAPLQLGGDRYDVTPARVPVVLDVSRMTGGGWSLRLRFHADVHGPCMRCLADASPGWDVDAREIEQAGGGPELDSPYVLGEVVDVAAWARDALALAMPQQVLCTPDCAGLCPECGERLDDLPPDHAHERAPDPRWSVLNELKFD
ncbi:MAG: DUF177 domain-containing protein [Solirubrobacterales bacterium]|nr:DUF177 domain-containing protein [Solirubrobacterales bacterium]